MKNFPLTGPPMVFRLIVYRGSICPGLGFARVPGTKVIYVGTYILTIVLSVRNVCKKLAFSIILPRYFYGHFMNMREICEKHKFEKDRAVPKVFWGKIIFGIHIRLYNGANCPENTNLRYIDFCFSSLRSVCTRQFPWI